MISSLEMDFKISGSQLISMKPNKCFCVVVVPRRYLIKRSCEKPNTGYTIVDSCLENHCQRSPGHYILLSPIKDFLLFSIAPVR